MGDVCAEGSSLLMHDRKPQNSVKQLPSNVKKKSVYYITYFEIPGCFIKSHNCQLNIILSIF